MPSHGVCDLLPLTPLNLCHKLPDTGLTGGNTAVYFFVLHLYGKNVFNVLAPMLSFVCWRVKRPTDHRPNPFFITIFL